MAKPRKRPRYSLAAPGKFSFETGTETAGGFARAGTAGSDTIVTVKIATMPSARAALDQDRVLGDA